MKLQIHIPSALFGGALLGLVLFASGAQGTASYLSPLVRIENPLDVIPREIVRIDDTTNGGTPYTVPAGKVLVVRSLTRMSHGGNFAFSPSINIDGQQAFRTTFGPSNEGNEWRHHPFEPGLPVAAGSVVEVIHSSGAGPNTGVAVLGYLLPK